MLIRLIFYRIEEVERTLADQRALHEDSKIRMQGTIDQQTKLIDFLQSKMDSKKKKVSDTLANTTPTHSSLFNHLLCICSCQLQLWFLLHFSTTCSLHPQSQLAHTFSTLVP